MVHGCHIYKIHKNKYLKKTKNKTKKKIERKSNRYQEIFGGILLFMAFCWLSFGRELKSW